ncbi:hypothetical protein [Azospirillum argentinense]|uniref:Uncharacterized protein n=1 Tax=Azospirillum brasilense TaxID=192 RepID=A0A4D8QB71_AZOBR|nr:hypothetical protein [Azospirillum argentinense]QCO03402.1 hypothetical protein D3867_15110 [Azospirillum argentinense]
MARTHSASDIARFLKAAGRPDPLPLKKLEFMLERQEAERTSTMLRFDHDTHVIRIINDSYGHLTVTVRERQPGAETLTFRFPKTRRIPRNQRKPRPRRATVYTFKGAGRLWDLAVEPGCAIPPAGEA